MIYTMLWKFASPKRSIGIHTECLILFVYHGIAKEESLHLSTSTCWQAKNHFKQGGLFYFVSILSLDVAYYIYVFIEIGTCM